MEEKIDYPEQTSEWGRSLIDIFNAQLGMIQIHLNGVKTDIHLHFATKADLISIY